MKYRMLTEEEMKIFDEDFKHFAVANGVTGEDWQKLIDNDKEKATQLVEIFSDTVLQKVYEKLRFIEHRSPSSCMVFKLGPENIELISINAKSGEVDLTTPESIHEALTKKADDLSMFKTKKAYTKQREAEIHEMLEQGCLNSSEAFWILLEKVIS